MKKKIANYDYFVDKQGLIYNSSGTKISSYPNCRDKYLIVRLWKGNKVSRKNVHRIVAETWIPNPEKKPCVNHIDGDKTNNKIENLEWCTYKENSEHSYKLGLQKPKSGEEKPNSVLTEKMVHEICKLMEQGYRNIDIHLTLGVNKCHLKNIRSKKCWVYISNTYYIPSKSRTVSPETIHWICRKIVEGYANSEILNMRVSDRINKSIISKTRRKVLYPDITKLYNY